MKLVFVKIGSIAQKPISSLIEMYEGRLSSPYKVSTHYIKDKPHEQQHVIQKLKEFQGPEYFRVALHETGKILSTVDYAKKFEQWISQSGSKSIVFFVGGPYGFPKGFLETCQFVWSLSKATFPSDYAWLLAWEQTYRAHTVLRNIPYHHE